MQPKLRASFNLLHLNSIRVTRAAINATFSTLQRRLTYIDPWLPVDTQVCVRVCLCGVGYSLLVPVIVCSLLLVQNCELYFFREEVFR